MWPCAERISASVAWPGGEFADVLGQQQVQPAQPVLAGDGDHAAVREVDETGARRPVRAARGTGRRSARRRLRRVPRRGRRRAGTAEDSSSVYGAACPRDAYVRYVSDTARGSCRGRPAQSAQRPKIAKCFMSVSKPKVSRSFAVNSAATVDVGLDDVPAVPADQMDVVVPVGEVVRGGAVPQMGVADQPQFLQQLQGPVDGGDVHAGRRLAHLSRGCRRGSRAPGRPRLPAQLPLRASAGIRAAGGRSSSRCSPHRQSRSGPAPLRWPSEGGSARVTEGDPVI